jgi:adenylate cyclase
LTVEIERKFLVNEPPDLIGMDPVEIEQGYLAVAGETGGAEVRLRSSDGDPVLTVKSAGGLSRTEEEIPLDRDRFDSLWPLTEGRRLQKARYRLDHEGAVIELDIYCGDLDGLAVAEVEFEDEDGAHAFEPPAWFGEEVTERPEFRNEALASRGRPG